MPRLRWVDVAEQMYIKNPNESTRVMKAAMYDWMLPSTTFTATNMSSLVSLREVVVELITGRTHQVRGQTKELGDGYHIAGDNLYTGMTSSPKLHNSYSSPFLALEALSITFPENFVFYPPRLTKSQLKSLETKNLKKKTTILKLNCLNFV